MSYTPKRGPVRSNAQKAHRAHLPAVAFMAYGRTFQQNSFLLPRPPRTQTPPLGHELPLVDHDNPMLDEPDIPGTSSHQRKRETQWKRWQNEIIPQLVAPYMEYMSRTMSLRNSLPTKHIPCDCPTRRTIEKPRDAPGLEKIKLDICVCASSQSAPQQLLLQGYFPCAPLFPSLAVSLKVLDFVSELFLNIPPNNTAWCKAHERFLDRLGFKLTTEGSMRKRFGNTLVWYNALKDATTTHIDEVLNRVRRSKLDLEDGVDVADEFELQDPLSSPLSRFHNLSDSRDVTPNLSDDETPSEPGCDPSVSQDLGSADEEDQVSANPFPSPLDRIRPSDFLRARCPLCFGGEFPDSRQSKLDNKPDIVVCVDACFTQKHNRQAYHDPPLDHPRSVFLSRQTIVATEKYVESLRPSVPRPSKRPRLDPGAEDDGFEHSHKHGTLRVPKSVLDGCEDSFTAADERRVKASTQFFDNTALMALLCRHDVVLFMVNMDSAGEKQHYVVALLETLFQHIPLDFHVGLLYDVGCQLQRSCIKWNFLDRYVSRITFGISVFHAFGHQWPCQLVYHPRKREGFGLSDGEGCERFWHSISKLIGYLRYHQRLYTLNHQVDYATSEIHRNLGVWLRRRFHHMQQKKASAEVILDSSNKPIEHLRGQWKLQVKAQTKALPRQSKNAGKNALHALLRMRETRDEIKQEVEGYNVILSQDHLTADAHIEALADLRGAKERLKDLTGRIQRKERALGVQDQEELQRLTALSKV
ncbi:hypothetical protein H0H92_006971 [Tricholoma furcatifolium]|nr:hypothetical protein H0H92_006971 [Tricholoma furcatifolium]